MTLANVIIIYLFLVLFVGLTSNVIEVSSTTPIPTEEDWYPTTNFSDTFDWKLLKVRMRQLLNCIYFYCQLLIIKCN